MKLSFVAILSFFLCAGVSKAEDCKKESLIHFFSSGKEVASKTINSDDLCDHFGGNLVYSPKYNLYLYVNFNIYGSINLDDMDQALDHSAADAKTIAWLKSVQVAVVDKNWIKAHYNDPREAVLNLSNEILFVSEAVVETGRFSALMSDFYSGKF